MGWYWLLGGRFGQVVLSVGRLYSVAAAANGLGVPFSGQLTSLGHAGRYDGQWIEQVRHEPWTLSREMKR